MRHPRSRKEQGASETAKLRVDDASKQKRLHRKGAEKLGAFEVQRAWRKSILMEQEGHRKNDLKDLVHPMDEKLRGSLRKVRW